MLGDRGYDSREICDLVESNGARPVIPARSTSPARVYDKAAYTRRNRIERLFGRLKEYRRLATRYDKLDVSFNAFITLAAIQMWVA